MEFVSFFAIALVVFLWWGFSGFCFGWALSWIVLLTIPLYYSLVDAIYKRKADHFAFPVLAAMAYILMGYFNIFGGWTVGWVVFSPFRFTIGYAHSLKIKTINRRTLCQN